MIEIFVDFDKIKIENREMIRSQIDILRKNGWNKFGAGSSMLLFREGNLEEAKEQVKNLNIVGLEIEETDYSVF